MDIQIEVTTHCNFGCWYCATHEMKNQHMAPATFERILPTIKEYPHARVMLQGEGEPTLNKELWTMASEIKQLGNRVCTTTNLSFGSVEKFEVFDDVAVSLDTLDPEFAEQIGRHDVHRVITNLRKLTSIVDPNNITINTVDLGALHTASVRELAKELGVRHCVRPLMQKADYPSCTSTENPPGDYYTCLFLSNTPRLLFFDVDGTMMPCCYIKNKKVFSTANFLKESLSNGTVPEACSGCPKIIGHFSSGTHK